MAAAGGSGQTVHIKVTAGSKLRNVERESGKMDPYVVVRFGQQEARSSVVLEGGTTCRFDLNAAFPLTGEGIIAFYVRDANERRPDEHVGEGQVWLEDLEYRDWTGHVELCTTLGDKAGRLSVEVRFSSEVDGVRDYAARLAEVVLAQHQARRQDWLDFRAREQALQSEVIELQHTIERWRSENGAQSRMETDLRFERRRRIDAEARLTELEHSAQLPTVNAEWNSASRELREARAQLQSARFSEDAALRSEANAEDRIKRLRQELSRVAADSSREFAESQAKAQAREAEVLGHAWQISGELRSELDACRSERTRQGLAPAADRGGADNLTSARQALHQLRGVRERYNGMLNEVNR